MSTPRFIGREFCINDVRIYDPKDRLTHPVDFIVGGPDTVLALDLTTPDGASDVTEHLAASDSLSPNIQAVQIVQAFASTIVQTPGGPITTTPAYVGLTDEDDAWIRRCWANNRPRPLRQYIWREQLFVQLAAAYGVEVIFRGDLAPGTRIDFNAHFFTEQSPPPVQLLEGCPVGYGD